MDVEMNDLLEYVEARINLIMAAHEMTEHKRYVSADTVRQQQGIINRFEKKWQVSHSTLTAQTKR